MGDDGNDCDSSSDDGDKLDDEKINKQKSD